MEPITSMWAALPKQMMPSSVEDDKGEPESWACTTTKAKQAQARPESWSWHGQARFQDFSKLGQHKGCEVQARPGGQTV